MTRSREQAGRLSELIHSLGGEPVELPTVRVQLLEDAEAVHDAIARLAAFDWVVFSSANAVRFWMERLQEHGLGAETLAGLRIATVGAATRDALRQYGLDAALTPPEYVAESLLQSLLEVGVRGARILFPAASGARDVLPDGLREAGAEVVQVPLYESVPDPGGAAIARERLAEHKLDAITFTSSSTVRSFAALIEPGMLSGMRVACIGPLTAATATELGLPVDVVAVEHTIEGLVAALVGLLADAEDSGGNEWQDQ